MLLPLSGRRSWSTTQGVGSSTGGFVAQEIPLVRPTLIRRLVLVQYPTEVAAEVNEFLAAHYENMPSSPIA
jgi:hypothetical protein